VIPECSGRCRKHAIDPFCPAHGWHAPGWEPAAIVGWLIAIVFCVVFWIAVGVLIGWLVR